MPEQDDQLGRSEEVAKHITPDEKEALNREGRESGHGYGERDGEGDGELYIGTRDEINRAKERVMTEGKAKDMEGYVRLHAEVVLTPEEVVENQLDFSPEKAGKALLYPDTSGGKGVFLLRYGDKSGGVKELTIKPLDIASIRTTLAGSDLDLIEKGKVDDIVFKRLAHKLEAELRTLGFRVEWDSNLAINKGLSTKDGEMNSAISRKRWAAKKAAAEVTTKNFDL